MLNPLQLSHRELRGLALLLVLLPVAPAALLARSMYRAEMARYSELCQEEAEKQQLVVIESLERFHQMSSAARPNPSEDARRSRLEEHLTADLDGITFAGEGPEGTLLIGTSLPADQEAPTIPPEHLGNLPLGSLRFLPLLPAYSPSPPIEEVTILALVVVGLLAGWAVNRQLKINEIENDSLSTIAHEIKTPISSSRVMLESLAEGTVQGEEATREYLEILLAENRRMQDLAENFLTHAKLEGKGMTMRPEELKVSALLKDAAKTYLPRFEGAGGTLTVSPPAGEPTVMADRSAIHRILGCLLDNAAKYSDSPPEATLRARTRGNQTMIEVADRGRGIPREEEAKIFDKFYQVDHRLERSRGGCGLGLTIARKLAAAQRGSLSIAPNPGGGSCFTLTLPTHRGGKGRLGQDKIRS